MRRMNWDIDDTAIVHPTAKIGRDVKIGAYTIIQEGCVIGDGTVVEHHVLLKKNTKIGKNCFVDSYVRSSGSNSVGNNVTLRFGATIAREVIVEDGVFISPNVMTIYSNHEGTVMPGTQICEGAHIGTAAVLGPAVYVGPRAVVGSMAFVKANAELEPDSIYIGIPAKKLER